MLYSSDQAQTYRVAACLIVEGAQKIKRTTLVEKSKFYAEKIREKTGFLGFSDNTSGKRFAKLLY